MSDLTLNTLVQRVHDGFGKATRERISAEQVRQVAVELDVLRARAAIGTPHLKVTRLRFTGEKKLHGEEHPTPFAYDQAFHNGVNVVLIPDNDVGKSSVLKTIRFALTGDDRPYDADVRSWIRAVWLEFSLGAAAYTVLLSRTEDGLRGALMPGSEQRDLNEVFASATDAYFRAEGDEAIQRELQRFFFQHLSLADLSYTRQSPQRGEGRTEVRISWLTYFQALYIADWGDRYLICDPAHATGNQDGLILSTFLGLDYVEALNVLGVQHTMSKAPAQENKESLASAEEARTAAETRLSELQAEIGRVEAAVARRRASVTDLRSAAALAETRRAIGDGEADLLELEEEERRCRAEAQRARAGTRRLREAVDFHRHFTGIEVRVCPNCDAEVAASAVAREQAEHVCRLCGRDAEGADAAEMAAFAAEAEHLEGVAARHEASLEDIRRSASQHRRQLEELRREFQRLTDASTVPLADAFPTDEEQKRYRALLEENGKVKADLAVAEQAIADARGNAAADVRRLILDKMRQVVRAEAERKNEETLKAFTGLTESVAKEIGADSISDVRCTALGKVELRKHDVAVLFTTINNQGERLRVKLAFFLALMRLGAERRIGKHPGFLLIDQPGTGEMVPEDFTSLARILRTVDEEAAGHLQIICFTARPEFHEATDPAKISGAKAGGFAF